jgi:hypothetical protein
MWLADLKLEWQGALRIQAGGRYAITHCCCNYPTSTPAETAALREQWNDVRTSFRQDWSRKFGGWPLEKGKHWPGHHIRDLGHGGHPTDPNNVLPTPPSIHDVFSDAYPVCYAGGAPWNMVGPELPYTDN